MQTPSIFGRSSSLSVRLILPASPRLTHRLCATMTYQLLSAIPWVDMLLSRPGTSKSARCSTGLVSVGHASFTISLSLRLSLACPSPRVVYPALDTGNSAHLVLLPLAELVQRTRDAREANSHSLLAHTCIID